MLFSVSGALGAVAQETARTVRNTIEIKLQRRCMLFFTMCETVEAILIRNNQRTLSVRKFIENNHRSKIASMNVASESPIINEIRLKWAKLTVGKENPTIRV